MTDRTLTRGPRTLPPLIVITLLSATLMSGCGAGESQSGLLPLTTTIDTVAGRIEVMNSGAPPAWKLHELLRLGDAGGDGRAVADDEFGRLTGVLADHDGLIYLADAQSHDIRVFSPEGQLLRRIGRQGAGPGEFGMLQSIGWIGDTIAVLDARNGRLALIQSDGEWAGQRPYMALTGTIRIHQTGPDELYMPMIGMDDSDRGELVYIRQTHGGAADTLRSPARTATGGDRPRYSVVCRSEMAISSFSIRFAPKLVFTPAPGVLIAQARTADYQIAFTDAAGDTVRLIQRDLPPLPVTDEEWRAEEARFEEWREQWAGASCEPARPARPTTKSMIREIFFDEIGNTWVERETTSGWAFDLFDRDGRLIAELPAPENRKTEVPPYVRDGRLYLITTDEMDIEYLKVYAIEGTGSTDTPSQP